MAWQQTDAISWQEVRANNKKSDQNMLVALDPG